MAGGIQVMGCENIIAIYERYGLDTWALVSDRNVVAVGTGADQLREWLDVFAPSGSNGMYQLRLYDNVSPDDIEAGSSYKFCIRCKLNDFSEGMGIAGSYGLNQRLSAIEKKLEEGEELMEEEGLEQ